MDTYSADIQEMLKYPDTYPGMARYWKRRREEPLFRFQPRPDSVEDFDEQSAFFNDKTSSFAVLLGGTGAGKTQAASAKTARHVLDNPAPRRDTPFWIIGETYQMVCSVCWVEKLSSFIPSWAIAGYDMLNSVRGWPHAVILKDLHGTGTNWVLEFKSYEQGRAKFQAASIGGYWFNEEVPISIVEEVQGRCREYDSRGWADFTPLEVRGPEWPDRYDNPPEGWSFYHVNTEMNTALAPGWAQRYLSTIPEDMRDTRRIGVFASYRGQVFKEWNKKVHVIEPFEIPDDWRRMRALDFGFNNPFCFDKETEILTRDGWKLFVSLDRTEEVATINENSHSLEWQKPTDYISYHYAGQMVSCSPVRGGAQFCVTPNHRMVQINLRGEWKKVRADEMMYEWLIPTSWDPVAPSQSDFVLPVQDGSARNRKELASTSREAFALFLGLFISEGYVDRGVMVEVVQKKYVKEVREAFQNLGWKFSESQGGNGVSRFRICSKQLAWFLSENCGESSNSKRIPSFVMSWDEKSLRALMRGLLLGDGCFPSTDERGKVAVRGRFYTTSSRLADDFQTIACLLGMPSRKGSLFMKGGYGEDNRYVLYYVGLPTQSNSMAGKLPIGRVDYDDMVYCVTVPNGMLVVRRNGKPMVSGNCCAWAARDPDGRYYIYDEHFASEKTIAWHAGEIKRRPWPENHPCYGTTWSDHDAQVRHELSRLGIDTTPARKDVHAGIELLRSLLMVRPDGKPRFFVFNHCENLIREMRAYHWPETVGKGVMEKNAGELPVPFDDHLVDCARYLCYSEETSGVEYQKPIERQRKVWQRQAAGFLG